MTAELSHRQRRILWLRAQGLSGPQIAKAEQIAIGTVDWHERVIRQALGARNMTHAVHLAHVAGLLRPERHGDHAGYTAHLRRGERPCDACRTGERVYRNDRKALSASLGPEVAPDVAESTEPLNSRQTAA